MNEPDEFESLRRQALASLGRNVLHFQRLETQLKLLTLFCDFQSPLTLFETNHSKHTERIRKQTMGTLVGELHGQLYEEPNFPDPSQPITEPLVAIGFRVNADPDYINQQKQKLSELVTERNQLIHHDIGDFDPNSPESCRAWITRLDEQNERILIQFKAVQELVDTCKKAFQEMSMAMNKRGFTPDVG